MGITLDASPLCVMLSSHQKPKIGGNVLSMGGDQPLDPRVTLRGTIDRGYQIHLILGVEAHMFKARS